MANIDDKGIRRFFYAGSLLYFLISITLLSIPIYSSISGELDSKVDQLEEVIIKEKREYIKAIVKEKISDIELELIHSKDEHRLDETREFEEGFRFRVKEIIHGTKLPDNGYVWINEVLDFNGGDNYAIRFAHPNLSESEGLFLSTSFRDIKGNSPYLDELDGIKKNGHVYYEYYFKKMNSEKISRKLSYAELFKPYNWIVATGVYLEDVDELISQEKEIMRLATNKTLFRMGYTLVIILIFFASIMYLFENSLEKIINRYISKIEKSNIDLSIEKDKLQTAYAKIEAIAYTDYLTGLINRRAMYGFMNQEIARMKRETGEFALLMCDIDYFKSINDTYGHEAGDKVLKKVSAVLKSSIRDVDRISRWGGEEFLCMLINVNLNSALMIAEKLRGDIEELQCDYQNNKLGLTITIGVAMFAPELTVDKLIDRADENLYKGKEAGRNIVIH